MADDVVEVAPEPTVGTIPSNCVFFMRPTKYRCAKGHEWEAWSDHQWRFKDKLVCFQCLADLLPDVEVVG